MTYIYLLNETVTNGLSYIILSFISLASVFCGIFVIISKNPIVSVLFLIGLFLSISGYLMMLGINFIGLSYLLVYVGAVSILFLFILMLINVRISELVTDTSSSIPLGFLIAIIFNSTIFEILPSSTTSFKSYMFDINRNFYDIFDVNSISYSLKGTLKLSSHTSEIGFVSSQMWDSSLAETSHITTIGNVLYTAFPIWLIITSLVLLLSMVGTIVITVKQ